MEPRIPTYFSHSYWPEDRSLNVHFWKLFWNAGFAFTVAPQSGRFSIPHLEVMMRRSACFVAVATHRGEQSHYLTSPYQVFEYGLAVQANRPRLVFLERGVARHYFEAAHRIVFDRAEIAASAADDDDVAGGYVSPQTERAVQELHEMSIAYARQDERSQGTVGLLLPRDGAYGGARPAIRDLLRSAGYEVVDVAFETHNAFELLLDVDRHDFVVIDVDADELPAWLHPLLYGRSVPMVRLVHHEPDLGSSRPLPELLRGHAIRLVASDDEMAIRWGVVDELVPKLQREVERLNRPRGQFRSLPEGIGYFNSLGRSLEGAVFVSNAGPENVFARHLSRLLDLKNIPFFHYVYRNTIELGTPWTERLRGRLEASQLFVPLITRAYWESEVCREEYRVATELHQQERLRIYPYFLEDLRDATVQQVALQGRTLSGLPLDQQLGAIVRDIDGYLTPGG